MIYYKSIYTNNQNKSNSVRLKGFYTSTLYETAFYNVYATFNLFRVRLQTKEVYKHSFTKNYKNIITKNRNNSNKVRKTMLTVRILS